MKRSWLPYLILTAVIAVLTLFFGLQYRWMRGERGRTRRMGGGSRRTRAFAEDFNREIQSSGQPSATPKPHGDWSSMSGMTFGEETAYPGCSATLSIFHRRPMKVRSDMTVRRAVRSG